MRDLSGKEMSLVFQDAQSALNPIEAIGPQLEEVILAHNDVSLRTANGMALDMLFQMGMSEPVKPKKWNEFTGNFSADSATNPKHHKD